MADSGIFTSGGTVLKYTGANVSSISSTEAYTNVYIFAAESEINVSTEYNWSDNYSTLNADVKGMLNKTAAMIAAMDVIHYDMSSIGVLEATTRCDILTYHINKNIEILKNKDKQSYITGA